MIGMDDPLADARRRVSEVLEASLLPMEARLRQRALAVVAARVAADLGDAGLARPALLAALARCADHTAGEVVRLRRAEAALGVAYQSASGAAERRELLARQLRLWADERRARRTGVATPWAWAQDRLDLAGDLAALGRNLDIEAAQERFAEEVADRVDEIEVAYHALAHLARNLDDGADALRAAVDGGVLRLALLHADPARPASARRAALLAAGALLRRIPARERLGHLGLDGARAVLGWARGADAGRWIQIAALEIAVELFPDEARSLLAERLRIRDEEDRDGPILRRNALRILGATVLPTATPRLAAPARAAPAPEAAPRSTRASRRKGRRATAQARAQAQPPPQEPQPPPQEPRPQERDKDGFPVAGFPASTVRERAGASAPPPGPDRDHACDSSPRLSASPAEPAFDDPLAVLWIARDDPSEHVRQELARQLVALVRDDALERVVGLAAEDPSPRVRGLALRELVRKAADERLAVPYAERAVAHALTRPGPPLPIRVALEASRSLCAGPYAPLPPDTFAEALSAFAARTDLRPELADEAAAVLRILEVEGRPVADRVRHALLDAMRGLLEGESARVELPPTAEPRDVERALSVAARGDMTVSLRRVRRGRWVITRGEPRGFRLWRLIHELRTPMPDKRKGYTHTSGRVPAGELIAPPIGMAEVTPTRVPGERHVHPEVGGWGVVLPRVDDLLATCGLTRGEVRIITAGGTLVVRGPERFGRRLRARALLTLRYERTAQARSRSLMAAEPAEQKRFAALLDELGFSVRLGDTAAEIAGRRFPIAPLLPLKYLGAVAVAGADARVALAAAPFLPVWFDSFASYLVSPAGNVPADLAWIVWVILAGLILRAAWIMSSIERARRGIPLSIGGWGTRGKSGSERLKAALFHALRYDVVVKTTGCEAMFIHAMRDLPAGEIFIYRPYDKATIWEQRNILQAGRNLRAQVFLWECMALQPLFVDTLCSEWMQDEITTLTNAYPDHEDIQGPGGEDVARVIARFMPTGGRTFTTEEQMLPLLRDAAKRRGTDLVAVPPLEADLLPVDLLDRLPYQEHPRNVALILTLAEHLGIDRELALVEIADHVILDLGVLKTYPTVLYRGRKLTFSNGMSANERAGFISNWTRLAFDKHDIDTTPGEVTVMVINNRADRVARSRVFAQIVVEDVGVDHVVLINTNLGGMMQFITEGLDQRLPDMVITGDGGKDRALGRFDEAMKRVGVPARQGALADDILRMLRAVPLDDEKAAAILAGLGLGDGADPAAVEAKLKAALEPHAPGSGASTGESRPASGVPEDLRPDVIEHVARRVRRSARRDKARAEVIAALDCGDDAGANAAFRIAFRELFLDRIAVLWNADAKGDKVVDVITREIPPGFDARLMGSQNIKGTGLDFVYRWLSMDRVRGSLERMKKNPGARREVLTWLLSYSDFGLIDCREALEAVRAARDAGAEWAEHANLLDGAIRRLEALDREKTAGLTVVGKAGAGAKILLRVEQLVDHLDSIRRTNRARVVMNDLFARRIGHGRAALLLREITGRGKGGWLVKDLAALREAWADRLRGFRRRKLGSGGAGSTEPPAGGGAGEPQAS